MAGQTTKKTPPDEPPIPLPGPATGPAVQVDGFRLVRELGRGGMGVIYEAWSEALAEPVALKVVLPDLLPDADTVLRVEREAAAQARLRHPNIVRVLDVGRTRTHCPWLALELVPGETLADLLRREGRLPEAVAAEWARALAEGMAHAHALGVIHRDLKPANVLLGPDRRPRLTDFGLARLEDDARRLTVTGTLLGSPAYMSPEQAQGLSGAVDARTDVYGLGAILYEMLSGAPPYQGSSQLEVIEAVLTRDPVPPSRRRPGLDPALEAICRRCLARAPDERWGSAEELARALERWLARAARGAAPQGLSPGLVAASASILGVALLVVVLLLVGRDPISLPPPPVTRQAPAPAVEPTPPADPLGALRAALVEPPTCAALFRAAELARAAGLGPRGDLTVLPAPERQRLLFALHVEGIATDPDALVVPSPALERLFREPEQVSPWWELGGVIVRMQGASAPGLLAVGDGFLANLESGAQALAWPALLRAALLHLHPGPDIGEARQALERALGRDPGAWPAELLRARFEIRAEAFGAARAALAPLLHAPDPPPAVLLVHAKLLILEGQHLEAEDVLRALAVRTPGARGAIQLRSELHLAMSQPAAALELAEELLRLPPATHQAREHALVVRGLALHHLAEYEQAARTFDELERAAQALGYSHVDAVKGWAQAMVRAGKAEEALRRLRARPLLDPRLRQLAAGVEAEARGLAAAAIPPGKSRAELLEQLFARRERGEWERVIPVIDRLLELDPDPRSRRDLLVERVKANQALTRPGEALRDLRRLPPPLDVGELYGVAACLSHLARFEEAARAWSDVLALEPEALDARLMLVRTLLDWGRLDAAGRELDELTERARGGPEELPARFLRVRVLRALGRDREALELLRSIPPAAIGEAGAPVLRALHDPLLRNLEGRLARR